jgi:hypothetical protein
VDPIAIDSFDLPAPTLKNIQDELRWFTGDGHIPHPSATTIGKWHDDLEDYKPIISAWVLHDEQVKENVNPHYFN